MGFILGGHLYKSKDVMVGKTKGVPVKAFTPDPFSFVHACLDI